MKFRDLAESDDIMLGQRLWVVDRSMPVVIQDKNDREIFKGKLNDFLVPKNEKYLRIPSKMISVDGNGMVLKLVK